MICRACVNGDHKRCQRGAPSSAGCTCTHARPSASERFWAKVHGGHYALCWLWRGQINADGYGVFRGEGRSTRAHRFAYTDVVADIPDGLQLDHTCRVRHCVNPWHLEPVTREVNLARGDVHGTETHCPQGHTYSPENTYRHARGDRQCRTCIRERNRQRRLAAS